MGGNMEPWWLWKTAAGTDAQKEHRASGRRLGASQAHLQVREVLIPSAEGVEPWAPGKFCRQEGPYDQLPRIISLKGLTVIVHKLVRRKPGFHMHGTGPLSRVAEPEVLQVLEKQLGSHKIHRFSFCCPAHHSHKGTFLLEYSKESQ